MEPDDVTAEWVGDVLGGRVRAVRTERIGDGLVGLNLRVSLEGADHHLPPSVVLKLPSLDEKSRATARTLGNYQHEVKFYTELADTVDIRVPHCHHGAWDPVTDDFVLVLEDMAPAEQGDQIVGCSVDQAAAAINELVRLHGPRWDDPTLFDVEFLGRRTSPEDGQMLAMMWAGLYPGFEGVYERYLSAEMLALVREFGNRLVDWTEGRSAVLTVTHGDFRLDNLLFATPAGGPPVTAVDWQTPGHQPAIGDVAYFCGAGLLPELRREHERDLLDLYRRGLESEYGVSVTSEWVWEQYRREAFGGVIMAVLASQIVAESERSEAMFAAMATRHLQHALDLDSIALV